MHWRKKRLGASKLLAVTDLKKANPAFLKKVEAAFCGGVDILELRSKHLSDLALYRLGLKLKRIVRRFGGLLVVNDRCDLAAAIGADGVHLGQDDMPIGEARRVLCDKSLIVGRSTHSLSQAVRAAKEGADYIGVGPIFGTPTKPDYKPVGLRLIRKVRRAVRVPFFAIGGVNESTIGRLRKAGAERVAVVRAIFGCRSTKQAARRLKEKLL